MNYKMKYNKDALFMHRFANGEFRIKFEKNKLDLDLEE